MMNTKKRRGVFLFIYLLRWEHSFVDPFIDLLNASVEILFIFCDFIQTGGGWHRTVGQSEVCLHQ